MFLSRNFILNRNLNYMMTIISHLSRMTLGTWISSCSTARPH